MKTLFTFVLCLFVLSGCAHTAYGRADMAKRAKTEMVGMTKMDLLLCAGVPDRTQQIDGMEFLAYYSNSISGHNGDVYSRDCEATFIFVNDMVEKVTYTGKTGGLITKGQQCAYIIQTCLQ
jgi:hypothetical protein